MKVHEEHGHAETEDRCAAEAEGAQGDAGEGAFAVGVEFGCDGIGAFELHVRGFGGAEGGVQFRRPFSR